MSVTESGLSVLTGFAKAGAGTLRTEASTWAGGGQRGELPDFAEVRQ